MNTAPQKPAPTSSSADADQAEQRQRERLEREARERRERGDDDDDDDDAPMKLRALDGSAILVRREAVTLVRVGSGARLGDDAPALVVEIGVAGAGIVTVADTFDTVTKGLGWA